MNAVKDPVYYNLVNILFFNYCFEREPRVINKISQNVKLAFSEKTPEEIKEWNQNKSIASQNSVKIQQNKIEHALDKIIHPNVNMNLRKNSDEELIEQRQKMSAANKDKVVTKETREKISKTIIENGSLAGENNPMYGNGHKISGEKNGMYGKSAVKGKHWKMTEEARENCRLGWIKRKENKEAGLYKKPRPFSEKARENCRLGQQKRHAKNKEKSCL